MILPSTNLVIVFISIIQDCEDALTNWVTANAAVTSKLSTRARNLSQRRKHGTGQRNPGGIDLSGQDPSLKDRESGLWVPAGAHREYADDDENEVEEHEEQFGNHAIAGHNAELRGREGREGDGPRELQI